MNPIQFAIAKRLDDLAYGTGVWYGALREGSLRALTPAFSGWSRGSRTR